MPEGQGSRPSVWRCAPERWAFKEEAKETAENSVRSGWKRGARAAGQRVPQSRLSTEMRGGGR